MVEAIGPARTRLLLYTGDRIDAATALAWGLVEHVHAPDALWGEAVAMAGRIAVKAPLSIRATKLTVEQILADRSEEQTSELQLLMRTSDAVFFLNNTQDQQSQTYSTRT